MNYVIIDLVSKFYVAVDPTPRIPFLLRESRDDGASFESRAAAIEAMEKASSYLRPHYSDLELVVRPARATQHPSKRQSRTSKRESTSTGRSWDIADAINRQGDWMRKYDKDMN